MIGINPHVGFLRFPSQRSKNIFLRWALLLSITAAGILTIISKWSSLEPNDRQLGRSVSRRDDQNLTTHSGIVDRARRLPQAIIIGARKSGTRALLKFLEINPAIRVAQNEVHFFDRPRSYKLGLDWYRSQMPESSSSQITIEKSPAYFVTPGVAERVKAMNSSIKLILILRNPVTRLISDYSQIVSREDFSPDDNVSYIDGEASGYGKAAYWDKAGKDFERYVLRPDGGINDDRRAIKTSMYSLHLEHWYNWFLPKQFLIVDGENFIVRPHEELQRVEQFLGLPPFIERKHFVFDLRKGFYCLAMNATNNVIVKRDLNHKLTREVEPEKTPHPGCLSRSKGRTHVVVSGQLKRRLHEFYAPYNQYLYSLINKSFGWKV